MIRPLRFILTALALIITGSNLVQADYLAGVTFYSNQLIRVDPTTGVGTVVGDLGRNVSAFGLAQTGGNLYTFDSVADVIRQVNPMTGLTGTAISIGIENVLGQGGMAFRNDGIGFLSSALNPTTFETTNNLYTFNIATGTSTLLGGSSATLAGLAFIGDVLYGIGKNDDTLYTVSQTNGALTAIGFIGAMAGSPIQALGVGANGQLVGTFDDRLYTINAATGAATPVDPNPLNDIGFSSISGLTYVVTPNVVPEPASVVLLGVGLAGTLITHRRRNRHRA